jgi:replicative DNA helicase
MIHDDRLEQKLVASFLEHEQVAMDILTWFPPDAIYNRRLQAIVMGISELTRKSKPVSPTTVSEQLLDLDLYEQSGGVDEIEKLSNNGKEPPNVVPELARQVYDLHLRRKQLEVAKAIADMAYDRQVGADDRVSHCQALIRQIEDKQSDVEVLNPVDAADRYLSILESRVRDTSGLKLPWAVFHRYAKGIPAGSLIALLGNPGAGKTAFLECLSELWAKQGKTGIFFHNENSTQYMLDRRTVRWANNITYDKLADGTLDEDEWQEVFKAWQSISSWAGKLYMVDSIGWSMSKVTATIRRMVWKEKIDFVVLDYLNKVKYDDRTLGLNTAQMRGQDVEDFKVVTQTYGLVGVIAGQFDKQSKRSSKRYISDSRDTGELEDKAQLGLILDREDDDNYTMAELVNIRIAKCNFGKTGTVQMRMIGNRYLYTTA